MHYVIYSHQHYVKLLHYHGLWIVSSVLKLTYSQALKAFILEAGLEPDAGSSSGDGITIESVLQEKK